MIGNAVNANVSYGIAHSHAKLSEIQNESVVDISITLTGMAGMRPGCPFWRSTSTVYC